MLFIFQLSFVFLSSQIIFSFLISWQNLFMKHFKYVSCQSGGSAPEPPAGAALRTPEPPATCTPSPVPPTAACQQ